MTTCPKCNYTRRPEDTAPDYECPKCGVVYEKFNAMTELDKKIQRAFSSGDWTGIPIKHIPREFLGRAISSLPVTTTPTVPGREITAVVDVVSAECAYGMNILKDFFAGITDTVGGRSGSTQGILRDARRTAMFELRAEAFSLGADAVVGVDLDYSEFSGGGKSMLFVVASGTAVKLAPAASQPKD